jgi:hypothetical protein
MKSKPGKPPAGHASESNIPDNKDNKSKWYFFTGNSLRFRRQITKVKIYHHSGINKNIFILRIAIS